MAVTFFSPAKINLLLAVTGRRADGFHDLVSVVAPLEFGDELRAELRPQAARHSLECDAPGVPGDDTNLVLRAAHAYAAATGWSDAAHFRLTKRIPVGAGLGGGSSNAVAALRALDALAGGRLAPVQLAEIAATLGSDCPLFLHGAPVVIRGRGERVSALPEAAARRLRGRRVMIFKPSFSISTAWAYARLAARGRDYVSSGAAEQRLAEWIASEAPAEELLGNNLEATAGEKFIALPVLAKKLRRDFGLAPLMSGSGSACFVLLDDERETGPIVELIRECWGPPATVIVTRMA